MHPEKSLSRILSISLSAFVALVLTACGGGGGGGGTTQTQSIGGGGVKGPLANAIVTAYTFDSTAAGYKGAVIDTGTTDASAKITGLALTLPLAPPYILEFTSDAGTTDITTGMAPVITTMRTVLTQALIDTGEDVYATPLTTMATDLAVANAGTAAFGGDDTAPVTAAEFVAALPVAASQVSSTLGFGIDSTIDIFDTPPLVDDTTDTTGEQTSVAAYRAAVEAVTAVVYEMDQQNSGTTPDSVLSELTADLANDGDINGTTAAGASTVLTAATLEVLDQDPALLPIPNEPSGKTVGDVEQVLINETATTGTTTSTAELDPTTGSIDTVVKPAETNSDIDGDGVLNANDAFPTDPTEDTDTDGDGTGNNADTDDDNDGVTDSSDDFPLDASEHVDTDGDGIGNNADTDDDGDGVDDIADDFPLDPSASSATDVDGDGWPTGQDPDDADAANPGTAFVDTDGDGMADSGGAADDTDDDNDGVDDASDCAPLDASKNVDTDGDGTCDVDDSDDDNDGTPDTSDAFPLNNAETTDTDGDGIGNNADTDDDNDGVSDTQEGIDGTDPLLRDTDGDGFFDKSDAFPLDATEHVDTDSDGTGDNADTDDDNDGVLDTDEIANGTKPRVADTDGDGVGDGVDALPLDATETIDTDGDGIGNNADTDDDGDGLSDTDEATAGTDPLVTDSDSDGVNDGDEVSAGMNPLSNDSDSDTILDDVDNCPIVANTDQADSDGNGVGDVCDVDTDGDGVSDSIDNCPTMANADQANLDGDSMGDVCDADRDGDGFDNTVDAFPDDASEHLDSDGDGVGDNADPCPNDATDSCPVPSGLDMTGVQRLAVTTQTVTELAGVGSCGAEMVGDTAAFYVTTTQTGTTGTAPVTMLSVWGDNLSGTVDTATGAYTLSGFSTFNDPYSSNYDTDTISVSGNAMNSTGSITVTEAFNGADQCTKTYNFTSANVYRHVGGEDYNGVYGFELDSGNDGRQSFAFQLEVSGSTITPHFPDGNDTISNATFDPATGFFSFDLDGTEDNGDGTSSSWHDGVTGIFVRTPSEATLPTVALAVSGYWSDWDAPGGSTGGGNKTNSGSDDTNAYGKRLSSTGFTRSSFYRSTSDGNTYEGIIMGMSHPPVKKATATSNLYVEVLDPNNGNARLCAALYPKRYVNTHYETAVDMTIEAFQSEWYSFVSCNTSTNTGGVSTHNVTDGMGYTVRIMDTGADGVIDGGDDTAVVGASMTVTAEVNSPFFSELPSVNTFALNGAAASKTMKQGNESGLIELFGFFDVNEDMTFSWTGITGAERYGVQVKGSTADIGQTRFTLNPASGTASTESITIPAGTLDMWDGNVIRVRARKDGATSNYRSLATSKWAQIQPGIRGLFNVELGGALGPQLDTFQVLLDGDMGDGTTGSINQCTVTNNPYWTCNLGSSWIDYTTNTVNLNMTDNTGAYGTVTLNLTFDAGSSANGTVSSLDVALTPAQTDVRLVNPELGVRTMQPSNGIAQQTLVTIGNTIAAGDVTMGGQFDKAVFKRDDNGDLVVGANANVGITAKPFWSEASAGGSLPFSSVVTGFQMHPTDDGVAQRVGHYIFDRTNSDWGLGAGVLDGASGAGVTYKAVLTSSADANLKWVFKNTYKAPDASALVTPLLGQVTVDLPSPVTGAQGSAGDAANPIDVSTDPTFPLTWTGSTVAGGEWQVRIIVTAGPSAGAEVRTGWMTDGVQGLTDNGNGTWSWVNGTGISLSSGDTVKVQIRTRDANNTMLGTQRMGAAVEDVIYLTMP